MTEATARLEIQIDSRKAKSGATEAARELDRLKGAARGVQGELDSLSKSGGKIANAGAGASTAAREIEKLKASASGATGIFGGLGARMRAAANDTGLFGVSMRGLVKGLDEGAAAAQRQSASLAAVERANTGAAVGTGLLGKSLGLLGPLLAGVSLFALAKDAISTNAAFQGLKVQLEVATGSAQGAEAAFGAIQRLASKTPYSVRELTQAFITLKNLGLDPSAAALTSYGNTASAMNKTLDQFVQAVADGATGQFERLKEFGIKASAQGDKVDFTFKGVTTTVANSASAIEGYLQGIGNTDFAGAMEKQSQTLAGALSNLGDNVDRLFLKFGEAGVNAALAETISLMNEGSGGADDFATELGITAGDALTAANDVLKGFTSIADGGADLVRDIRAEFAGLSVLADVFQPLINAAKTAFNTVADYLRENGSTIRDTLREIDSLSKYTGGHLLARAAGQAPISLVEEYDKRRAASLVASNAAKLRRDAAAVIATPIGGGDILGDFKTTPTGPAGATGADLARQASAAKKIADESERAAKAAAARRTSLNEALATLEREADATGQTKSDRQYEADLYPILTKYSDILTANDRDRAKHAAMIKADAAELAESFKAIPDTLDATLTKWAKSADGESAAFNKALEDNKRAADEAFRYISDSFYDAMTNGTGGVWRSFKQLGLRTISEVAAQMAIFGKVNFGQTSAGSLLGSLSGAGGAAGGGSGLTSLLGAGSGIAGLFSGGAAVTTAASVLPFGGTIAAATGATAAGSLAGVATAFAAAAPYLAAAAAAALVISKLVKKDPYSDAALTTSATGIDTGRTATRGTGSSETLNALTSGVSDQLAAIAKQLGGSVNAGIGLGSIGTNRDKFYYNPSAYGYKASGSQVYGTADAAMTAAVSAALSKGAISGISQSIKNILSGSGDIATRVAQATQLQAAYASFDKLLDPTGDAVKELNAQFATLRELMTSAGASTEEFSKANRAYDAQLAQIKGTTADATDGIKAYLNSLKTGQGTGLSADIRYANSSAQLAQLNDARASGKPVDFNTFQSASESFLSASRDLNGSTTQYFADLSSITATLESMIAASQTAADAAAAQAQPVVDAVQQQTSAIVSSLDAVVAAINANGAANTGTYANADGTTRYYLNN